MKRFSPIITVSILLFSITVFAKAQTKQTSNKDEQPKVVKAVAPTEYPFGNLKNALGDVIILVSIDATGKVISTQAASGHPILRPMCVKVAKRWIFEPIGDSSRKRTVALRFRFLKAEKDEDAGIFFKPPYTTEYVSVEVK